jgi:hypothetical protein
MIYAIVYDFPFIAEIHTPAKVWVSHGEYTISESDPAEVA